MPISLEALISALNPEKTTLLLGAGAAVPSGGPSGASLAHRLWRAVAKTEAQSDDLIETASILERRYTRRALVNAVIATLKGLRPTGGILGLPKFGWSAIYSTNFDQLVEQAYSSCGVKLTAIRSNYDFSYMEGRTGTCLYKLHGCISKDRSLGDKASMILTEQDYEIFSAYRQSMFSLLQSAMNTSDILVVGQSLRDHHLSQIIKKVLTFKQEGAPGQVYILVYDEDDLRAPLLEDRGAKIAFAGIDEFVHKLADDFVSTTEQADSEEQTLPLTIVSTVDDATVLKRLSPNVIRMFNGGPATFADIASNSTFERNQFSLCLDKLTQSHTPVVAIVGAAGVGKTTLGRQLLIGLSDKGLGAYEHRNDFIFQSKPWQTVEADLRSQGKQAYLLLDECTRYMRQTNKLIEYLADLKDPALKLILTANAAQWAPRIKTAEIFSKGFIVELSKLEQTELYSLINLVEFNPKISTLVQGEFRKERRDVQFRRLREKCSADMFVCLKNIFANESLDNILLTEFDELHETLQEHYRYVAALESVGTRVHRQLLVRMLNLPPNQVASVLAGLSGIVEEFDIKPKEGVYGWTTRHLVIARKITDYKFSSVLELEDLFNRVIDNINPAVSVELQSIRDLCDTEFGIGRLSDSSIREKLYRRLIEIAPAERVPWHRLIRELLNSESLEDVEYVIRNAVETVGPDGPIDRYRVRLLLARAKLTQGIAEHDRVSILRKAYELATKNVSHHRYDKHSYRVLCQVAIKLIERGESPFILDEAIAKLRSGADKILDPEMQRDVRYYEDFRARLN